MNSKQLFKMFQKSNSKHQIFKLALEDNGYISLNTPFLSPETNDTISLYAKYNSKTKQATISDFGYTLFDGVLTRNLKNNKKIKQDIEKICKMFNTKVDKNDDLYISSKLKNLYQSEINLIQAIIFIQIEVY